MPVLEDLPIEEKVQRGNVLLKTRVRDAEDSLAQLVHDEDQIVAAAAIQFVEQRGLWTLADDLEYALEHRDVRDWYVFEAASWALAAQRMTAGARADAWLEPLPAVELADRLRRLPLFRFTSIDELFRVAAAGRQVRHEPGRVLYEPGARATTCSSCSTAPSRGPAPRSAEEIDRRRPRSASTRCSRACRSRRRRRAAGHRDLPVAAARAVPGAAVGEHRAGAGHLPAAARRARRRAPGAASSGAWSVRRPRRGCATACSRSRRSSCSKRCRSSRARRSDQLAALAAIAREVKMTPRARCCSARPTRRRSTSCSRASCRSSRWPAASRCTAVAGDAVGVYETLGGSSRRLARPRDARGRGAAHRARGAVRSAAPTRSICCRACSARCSAAREPVRSLTRRPWPAGNGRQLGLAV